MFQIEKNNIPPEKGNILISEPFLSDKYFERSVVLLVQHDNFGSMGFVLNKELNNHLASFFPKLNLPENIPVFKGGPVSSDQIYFIHTLGDTIPDSIEIMEGVYLGGDFDVIINLLKRSPITNKVKFFLGYSGWGENQLLHEIEMNSWLVGKTEANKIMKNEGEIMWKKSLSDLGDKYRSWANFPRRPFLN